MIQIWRYCGEQICMYWFKRDNRKKVKSSLLAISMMMFCRLLLTMQHWLHRWDSRGGPHWKVWIGTKYPLTMFTSHWWIVHFRRCSNHSRRICIIWQFFKWPQIAVGPYFDTGSSPWHIYGCLCTVHWTQSIFKNTFSTRWVPRRNEWSPCNIQHAPQCSDFL